MCLDRVVPRFPEGGHVPSLAVPGQYEDAADPRTGQLAEDSLDVRFQLGHRERDRPGKPTGTGSGTVGDRGSDQGVDAFREGEGRRLRLDLVRAEGEVGAVRLERADGDDHERMGGEPSLERAGIKVEEPS